MEQILTVILIPLSIYLDVLGVTCTRGLEFARSLNGPDVVTTVQGVSIATCEQQCEDRGRCKSAMYYRQSAYCLMTSTSPGLQTLEPSSKAVLLKDFHPNTETADCEGSTCTSQETCKEVAPGSRGCAIIECPTLPSFYEKVSGNMYNVGNRLIARGSPQDMRVTCGPDGGWVPDSLHVVHDCTDMFGDSGVYTIGATSYQVYCDMNTDEGHWLVLQRRLDGSENFLRNWVDYQNGFGSLLGEFWLGLDLIRQLVIYGEYELRVDLEDFSGEKRFAKYNTFSISDETDLYRLTANGYSGTAGDSFSGHSGYNFSTTDNDNDACLIVGCNCAVYYKGAWWYTACHASNLNGMYFHGGQNTTQYANHVHWSAWHGYWISLKRTEMKIRRKWTG